MFLEQFYSKNKNLEFLMTGTFVLVKKSKT